MNSSDNEPALIDVEYWDRLPFTDLDTRWWLPLMEPAIEPDDGAQDDAA